MLARPSMTDLIANDNDGRWDTDRAEFSAETEQRSWEHHADRWPEAKDDPIPEATNCQRTTATASWQRSILIIAALSALAWAGIALVVIVALSTL
jgi:hypothetical protein